MAVLTLRGVIAGVGEIQRLGEKQTEVQQMILEVAARTDEFNEKVGRDNQWCLKAIGKRVDELKMSSIPLGSKVEVKCYFESYLVIEGVAKPFYAVESNIRSISLI